MSSSETTDSPQVKVIRSLIQGYQKMDVEHVAKHWHKDVRRITYPRSLGIPELNREEWLQRLTELISLWTSTEMVLHSITEAPGKVVVHITVKAKTHIGVEMIRETIAITHLIHDEDGSLKVIQFDEFADSKAYLDFYKAVAAAKAGKETSSHAA